MKKQDPKKAMKLAAFAVVSVLAIILGTIKPFSGLEAAGMRFLGIFVWWVIMQAINLFAGYMVTVAAMLLLIVFGCNTTAAVLSPFGGTTVWMVIGAFGMSVALVKCGLFKRISLNVMRLFPGTYCGQLLSTTAASVILSPCIPNGYAKDTILLPVVNSVSDEMGYQPRSKGVIGLYIIPVIVLNFVGAMTFMSGSSFPATAMSTSGVEATWIGWLITFWPWGLAMVVLYVLFCLFMYNPKKDGVNTVLPKEVLRQKCKELGPMSGDEKFSVVILVLTVIAWVTEGSLHSFPTCVPALAALLLLYLKGIFTDQDVSTKIPWTLVIYIGGITALLTTMSSTGVTAWVGETVAPLLSGAATTPITIILTISLVVTALRFAVVATPALAGVMVALFSNFGINPMVVAFAAIAAGSGIFVMSFQNTQVMTCISLSEGRVVHKDLVPAAAIYIVFNIISLLICIPWWNLMGML